MSPKGFCPNCEKETQIEQKERNEALTVKGEEIGVRYKTNICQECATDFYDSDSDPQDIAFREYRKKYSWTQPEEIVAFRKRYGFSQIELANLLGWGIATLSRYENGALQNESHETALKLLTDPLNIIRLLKNDRDTFSHERRQALIDTLTPRRSEYMATLVETIFAKDSIDEFSGFRRFELKRLKAIIQFLCRTTCQKTNLNKLAFYADFKACKESGFSLTGSRYVRISYGPVIDEFNYYFGSMIEEGLLEMDEIEYPNGFVAERYTATREPDLTLFNDTERDILSYVKRHLGGLTATEIANRSHKETAYKKTKEREPISYIHAKSLTL